MKKPSHLPFHLLAWGQRYVKHHNCKQFYTNLSENSIGNLGFTPYTINETIILNDDAYKICSKKSIPNYHGGPIELVYMKKNDSAHRLDRGVTGRHSFKPIRYVYYTECDQVVYFEDRTIFTAISAASNETTFVVGRRKEKERDSDPKLYMANLTKWRDCGVPGYSLVWPNDKYIRLEK